MPEHEIKLRLNRFLFDQDTRGKPCIILYGSEKMWLMICSLMISNQSPDLFILDEPTNNPDMRSMEILKAAINDYYDPLMVV